MQQVTVFSKRYGNHVAYVDPEDFKLVSPYRWHLHRVNESLMYAVTSATKDGRIFGTLMHRLILGNPKGPIDHIDRDGLNNTRLNLRVCSHSGNMMNRKIQKNNISGYRGVHFDPRKQKWRAVITANGTIVRIGYFATPEAAAHAYDEHSMRLHGQFGRLNFP